MVLDVLLMLVLMCVVVALFTKQPLNISLTITHKHITDQPTSTPPLQQIPDQEVEHTIAGLAEAISSFIEGGLPDD